MSHSTSCHCGAVKIQLSRPIRQLTRCNCSICRRYGALWAYQQRKAIAVSAKDGVLRTYSWGSKALQFHFCSVCGCMTHYHHTKRRADGSDMSAVNMRNSDAPQRIAHLPIRLLDGAGSWKVLERTVEPHLLLSPDAET